MRGGEIDSFGIFLGHQVGGLRAASHEFSRRCFPGSVNSVPGENSKKCERQNFNIEPESMVIHIPDIEIKFLLPGNGVSTVDLRPAGDARPDLMPARLRGIVAIEIL